MHILPAVKGDEKKMTLSRFSLILRRYGQKSSSS